MSHYGLLIGTELPCKSCPTVLMRRQPDHSSPALKRQCSESSGKTTLRQVGAGGWLDCGSALQGDAGNGLGGIDMFTSEWCAISCRDEVRNKSSWRDYLIDRVTGARQSAFESGKTEQGCKWSYPSPQRADASEVRPTAFCFPTLRSARLTWA